MRGMVRIEAGRSGINIVRFNAFERFVHWMTATCFIVLALIGPQHHLRQGRAAAADRAERILDVVAGGQICAQLPQLPVHARRHPDLLHVARREYSEPRRRRMAQARRRHRRRTTIRRPTASTPVRRRVYWIVVLGGTAVAVSGYLLMFPFYGDQHRRHAARADRPRHRRRAVRRRDARAHLYRHHRHGRRVRSHGRGHRRPQLGQGAPQPVARGGTGAHRSRPNCSASRRRRRRSDATS